MTDTNDIELISQPNIITGHLRRLLRDHVLLNVHMPDSDRFYNSILIDVDAEQKYILLDALHPESGHQQILKERQFTVSAQYQGIEFGFNGNIDSVIDDGGKPAYRVKYPEVLRYHQRRASFRAPVSMGDNAEISVRDEAGNQCKGLITNISLGGIAAQFAGKQTMPFEKNMILPVCRFATGDKTDFECALEIRNIKAYEDKNMVRVGARFIHMGPIEERQIQRFVVQLERDMIRRSQR
ncbi:flagellar brake protein [Sulfuriflexus mobilis]|uniref:flagellar brake protein n=1 Tax=Sulfuriflexus mobilis TaxID=1811807 RepID=UPI000F821CAB|nr:flagellar brake protein [Sulfuriflexus mobilis]